MCSRYVDLGDVMSKGLDGVRQLMADGWEPFAVVGLPGKQREMWFRRMVMTNADTLP